MKTPSFKVMMVIRIWKDLDRVWTRSSQRFRTEGKKFLK